MENHRENLKEEFDYKKLLEETSSDKPKPGTPELKSGSRHLWAIILIVLGIIMFLNNLGVSFPDLNFQWEYIVILVGLYIGYNRNWKRGGWMLAVAVGVFFLIGGSILSGKVIFPILLIVLGWHWYHQDGTRTCCRHRKEKPIERLSE